MLVFFFSWPCLAENNLLRCHCKKLSLTRYCSLLSVLLELVLIWRVGQCLSPTAVSSFGSRRLIPSQHCYMSGSCAGSCNTILGIVLLKSFFPPSHCLVKYRIHFYSTTLSHHWLLQLRKIVVEVVFTCCRNYVKSCLLLKSWFSCNCALISARAVVMYLLIGFHVQFIGLVCTNRQNMS